MNGLARRATLHQMGLGFFNYLLCSCTPDEVAHGEERVEYRDALNRRKNVAT
jgi:hypothetical protein